MLQDTDKSDVRKPVIGLVGGVGSGKSTVAGELVALGCALIDGDRIGHELLADVEIQRQLRQRWGERVFEPADAGGPSGEARQVNRRVLAEVVFADPRELDALNRILHPAIRSRIEERIAEAQRDPSVKAVVLDAAVMIEAGWDELCGELVFIKSPDSERARRVSESRGWGPADWQAREKSQISLDTKRLRCNHYLDNSSNVSFLREQVRELFSRITHAAERR